MSDVIEAVEELQVTPVVTPRPPEKEIYEKAWSHKEYREVSFGELAVKNFLDQAKPKRGAKIADLGCGTGRGGFMLAVVGGMDITFVDFATNCLDDDIRQMLETQKEVMHFVEADLTKPLPIVSEYGYCCDVMEHIPPEDVDNVLDNILTACQHVYFQISTVDDVFGATIGHPLHLTVKPFSWWLEKFNHRKCTVHWSEDRPGHCSFYLTAWMTGREIVSVGSLNTEKETLIKNISTNITRGFQQVGPYEANDLEVMILGGGPSLDKFKDDIIQKRKDGVKLIALNNTYNWCLENDIIPSASVIVDARPFNKRFISRVIDDCKYFFASQCDPSIFDDMPQDRTYIFHTGTEDPDVKKLLDETYEGVWYRVPGGSTVLLRTIPLFRLLGFKYFHLYGCDSCIIEDKHHSYEQIENDSPYVFPALIGGKSFKCHPWMIAQAQEFIEIIRVFGEEINLAVYGDGLLAYILETGAKLEENKVLV